MLRAREKELSQYGISAKQAAVLNVIEVMGEGTTVGEISRWLYREPHSTSTQLTRMEKQGLITKVKERKRKPIVRVYITEKGREAYKNAIRREVVHRIIPSLSKEQRQQLAVCLEILRDKALEELAIRDKPPFPSRDYF